MHQLKLNAQKIEDENRRIQEQSRESQLQRIQEALKQMQENQKIQDENKQMHEENRQIREAMKAEQEKQRVEQEKQRAEQEKRKMNELAKEIEEDANKRIEKEIWLRKEAERNHAQGIAPVKYPTGEEITAARERLNYRNGDLHLAITGVSGSGKSSLINAFRGLREKNEGAAKTGVSETTEQIGRYCDPVQNWIFWYDVPGAGTLKVPDWQYFNDQGLYIFDIIIIAVDIRFTKIDVGLLFSCSRFGIPVFVVRSKADQHITNIMNDGRDDDDGDESDESPEALRKRTMLAYEKFSTETRQEFEALLKTAGLPPQEIYIVSKNALSTLLKGLRPPVGLIDEVKLMKDVIHVANKKRR